MPTPITDVSTFTSPIQGPADADAQQAASYNLANQGLSNRTRDLLERVRGDKIDPSPPTKSVWVPALAGYSQHGTPPGWGTINGSGWIMSTGNVGLVYFPLDVVPTGASLIGVQVRVQPGAARVGANRMSASFLVVDPVTPASSTGGAALNDDGTTNVQSLSLGFPGGAPSVTIDKATKWYAVALAAGNTGAASPDACFGVLLTWLDPGPRNF